MRKFISVTLTVLMFVFLTVMLVLGLAFTFIEGRHKNVTRRKMIFLTGFIAVGNKGCHQCVKQGDAAKNKGIIESQENAECNQQYDSCFEKDFLFHKAVRTLYSQ